MNGQLPQVLYGMKIVVAPTVPKMTLSEDVMVWPEVRKEMNEWMLEFFGTTCAIPKGTMYLIQEKTWALHPEDYAEVTRLIENPKPNSFSMGYGL